MPRHAQQRERWTLRVVAVITFAVAIVAAVVIVVLVRREGSADGQPSAPCTAELRVVAASSYVPVLQAVAPGLATGPDCVLLDVQPIDGRTAAGSVQALQADLWIPDDLAWAGKATDVGLAQGPTAGAGTVLATSPLYLVTDSATGRRVTEAGGGWRAVVDLAGRPNSGVRLVMSDPAGSGDGLLAAGALGEAVWNAEGMDASSEALWAAAQVTRTVPTEDPVLPPRPGEVGLVSERALLAAPSAVRRDSLTILAPTDWTAALRYAFLPTVAAALDPVRGKALGHLLSTLTGPAADTGLANANLRRPDGAAPPNAGAAGLPAVGAPMFDVLGGHHVDHVFATWYAEDRRADVLMVVDVSGSMAAPAPGTGEPLINLVGTSVGELAGLLPDDARLGLWEFGSNLAEGSDHRVLVPPAALDAKQRNVITQAIGGLRPQQTGTGLHDTILAAYRAARETVRPDASSHVVVFTDGRNEDDEPTLDLAQLTQQITETADARRPVLLTVIALGPETDATALGTALQPVQGYVDPVANGNEIRAAFLHAAAGGEH